MFGFAKKSTSNRNLRDAGNAEAPGPASATTPRGQGGGRFNPSTFALLTAAEQNQIAELTRLLNLRAGGGLVVQVNDWDELGRTALHVAARNGHLDAVKLLVENHGADINAVTLPYEGEGNDEQKSVLGRKSPLHMALEALQFEVAHYLLAKGALAAPTPGLRLAGEASNSTSSVSATTALHLAAANCPKEGDTSATKTFIDMVGVILMVLGSANHQDALGNTGLHYAVAREHLALVNLLLKHHADPTIVNNDGDSSLLLAIRRGRREIILAILSASTQAAQTLDASHPSPKITPAAKEPELNLQRGWLRKKIQASDAKPNRIRKKWQKRYVELRQSSLVYYKTQQQSVPSLEVELRKATVLVSAPHHKLFVGINELAADPSHPFSFAIKQDNNKDERRGPGGDEDAEASGKATKTLVFSTASEEELVQWVQSILDAKKQLQGLERNSMDPNFPRKVTAAMRRVSRYFEDVEQQRREAGSKADDKDGPLEDCAAELAVGTAPEGKEDDGEAQEAERAESRRSGVVPLHSPELWNAEKADEKEINQLERSLRKMADFQEASFDFGAVASPYSIFQFLLAIIKQLHMPLLTYKAEASFLAAAAVVDPAKRLEQYRSLLRTSVPSDLLQKIRILLPLLRRLEAQHARNGMTYDRLGDIFVPVFIRGRMEKAASETAREKYLARTLLEDFIKHQERLFAEKPEEGKDVVTVQLEGEYAHFRLRLGSQGLLHMLDQEVEAIRLRWEEVKDIGKGESGSRAREWEKTIQRVSALGEGIQTEMDASAKMTARVHAALAESQQAIEAMPPCWTTSPDPTSALHTLRCLNSQETK